MDHLQVARPARQDQRQGDGGPAAQRDDGGATAVRRQAADLWRLRKPGESVARKGISRELYAARWIAGLGAPDADCGAQRMMIIIPFSGREPVFARTLRQTGFTG